MRATWKQDLRKVFIRPRDGFSLLDVALATVIITSGTMFMGAYFRNVYDRLDPRSTYGGIRSYLMSEQMLRAQAEGLRLLEEIPSDAGQCRLVTPPTGYTLALTQYKMPTTETNETLYYFDMAVTPNTASISTISISTLRRHQVTISGSLVTPDDKIGL